MTKTILITGTSSGLGRASAKLFGSRGWNVVATMRSPEAESELTGLANTLVTRLDVTDETSAQAAVAAGIERFGQIDALVNNAGYGAYGPLEATPLEKARRQLDVNVLGVLATTKAVLPHFRERRAGTILNISSTGGRVAFPLGTLYHASKFAVEGLSEALQYELAALGIRVKVLEPGGMPTDFGGRSLDLNLDPGLPEYQPLIEKVLAVLPPMLENGSAPEVIAERVLEAVTDQSTQLRYEAGADATEMLAARGAADDEIYFDGIRALFGLAG